jgi:hypothetical protein
MKLCHDLDNNAKSIWIYNQLFFKTNSVKISNSRSILHILMFIIGLLTKSVDDQSLNNVPCF